MRMIVRIDIIVIIVLIFIGVDDVWWLMRFL